MEGEQGVVDVGRGSSGDPRTWSPRHGGTGPFLQTFTVNDVPAFPGPLQLSARPRPDAASTEERIGDRVLAPLRDPS